ncbi:MAG: LamG domain-containing protein, partial [Planctomycetales bacterium]|nr:LamG domain-containing protein [Planctomycetales bacterium]
MRKLMLLCAVMLCFTVSAQAAEITWWEKILDEDADVSNFGTVVEAFAFTGDRGNNAMADTFPLDEPFDVNGTTFTPLNFTLGDLPEFLEGMTYNNGEYGHTTAEDGYEAILAGLAFEAGVGEQLFELTGLTAGQGYQVEFYYYHSTVDRSNTYDDGEGGTITVGEGRGPGIGGIASGYFVADGGSQEIISTASAGSHYINGYQLRAVPEQPPIDPIDPVDPTPGFEYSPFNPALVGYWNFDDNVEDHSGRGNHGEILGGVEYDSDVPAALGGGKSANFDGVAGTFVNVQQNELLPITKHEEFTISLWVKGDGISGDNNDDRVFSEAMTTNNNPLFNIGTKNDGADGTVDFYFRNGDNNGHQFSQEEAFDDSWHHILWVDRESTGTLYIDGVEDTTFEYQNLLSGDYDPDTTTIGGILRATDCCNFTGNIDDVSIFSFALSGDDIASLADGGSPLDISIPGAGVPGDFNGNGARDVADLDMLTAAVAAGDASFDLDGDGDAD